MKTLIASLVTLTFALGLVSQADAANYMKKKRLHASPANSHGRVYGYRDPDDSIGGYYEHRLNAVRFGSQRWWKIYDEQSGGRRR